MRPFLKNKLESKSTLGAARVVDPLPSKCEVLNPIPSTDTKGKEAKDLAWRLQIADI
jgi:hypothetical protein